MQPCLVAEDDDWLLGHVEMPVMAPSGSRRVADPVDHELGEIDGIVLEWPALVEAGEQKQIFDKCCHAYRLGLHTCQRVGDLGGNGGAAAAGELGVAADGCDRCAQLVASVGDELAHPRLT